jgi:hypothetical protein
MFKWFKKKKPVVPYIPMGRIGFYRKQSYGWYYTIIVERIIGIGTKSMIKVLDVKIDLDSSKSKKECLKNFGYNGIINNNIIEWESDEQMNIRLALGNPQAPVTYMVEEEEEKIKWKLTPLDMTN